jgi:hypothetical protein
LTKKQSLDVSEPHWSSKKPRSAFNQEVDIDNSHKTHNPLQQFSITLFIQPPSMISQEIENKLTFGPKTEDKLLLNKYIQMILYPNFYSNT